MPYNVFTKVITSYTIQTDNVSAVSSEEAARIVRNNITSSLPPSDLEYQIVTLSSTFTAPQPTHQTSGYRPFAQQTNHIHDEELDEDDFDDEYDFDDDFAPSYVSMKSLIEQSPSRPATPGYNRFSN